MIFGVLAGFFSGIISGMGIGGGTVLIPALTIFLNVAQHNAQGINLLYFIPTALIALVVHFKNRAVDLKVAFPMMLTGVFGACGGAMLASVMEATLLKKLFAR